MASDDPSPVPAPAPQAAPSAAVAHDPVRARRAAIAKWNRVASRLGYFLYLFGFVMFFVAFATDFTSGKVTLITASLIVGSVLLAPAIVIGYAVKAAEKDDVARGL